MNGTKQDACANIIGAQESDSLKKALTILFRAARCAAEANRDIWDFAVEAEEFQHERVLSSDLRWLLAHGYVVHAQEVSRSGESARKFLPLRNLAIPERTCFVLTSKGGKVVSQSDHEVVRISVQPAECSNSNGKLNAQLNGDASPASPAAKPHWDSSKKQLSFGTKVVKRFRRPAPNQEAILIAFQEEHWPTRIDDPLSQVSDRMPARRLHDAIKALNRHHSARIIRFHGDGEGRGVLWESV